MPRNTPAMPAELATEGYQLHIGRPDDEPELQGCFWWTLGRPGWTEYESSRTFRDYRAVINHARRHCDKEKARGADAWT